MPPATLAAIAPFVLGAGAMIDQNVQNKAAIKNAQNAEEAASTRVQQNQTAAQGNLNKYLAANPGPAQPGNAPSARPAYSGASVPMVGAPAGQPGPGMQFAPGGASTGGGQLSPQVLALLSQLQQPGQPPIA